MFGWNGKAIIATGTALLALVMPGVARADGACDDTTTPETTQAFAAFGDDADYFLAPGGDFESDAAGWKLHNAAVIDGNEDAGVLGGDHSLLIGDDDLLGGLLGSLFSSGSASRAVSPPFCVTEAHPAFRYLFRAEGLAGQLTTSIRYRDADGDQHEQEVDTSSVTTLLPGQWQPSEVTPLATALPLDDFGGAMEVQLVFRAPLQVGGGFGIDNVLVDPFRTR